MFWGLRHSLQSGPHPIPARHIARFCTTYPWEAPSYSGLSFPIMRWLFKLISGKTEMFRSQLLFLKTGQVQVGLHLHTSDGVRGHVRVQQAPLQVTEEQKSRGHIWFGATFWFYGMLSVRPWRSCIEFLCLCRLSYKMRRGPGAPSLSVSQVTGVDGYSTWRRAQHILRT